jgi:hypothetical protein
MVKAVYFISGKFLKNKEAQTGRDAYAVNGDILLSPKRDPVFSKRNGRGKAVSIL